MLKLLNVAYNPANKIYLYIYFPFKTQSQPYKNREIQEIWAKEYAAFV